MSEAAVLLRRPPQNLVEDATTLLGLSEQDIAGFLRTNVRTVERWKTAGTYPQREARARLAELDVVLLRLRETFDSDEASREWLHRSSPFLGGLSPVDAMRAGRADRVLAALEAIDSGFAS